MRLLLLAPLLLAACQAVPPDPEQVALACERRAQEAQGPTGSATVGVSSDSGPFTSLSVGLSSDYLQGRDPLEVYDSCVRARTGAAPIRPPRLRS